MPQCDRKYYVTEKYDSKLPAVLLLFIRPVAVFIFVTSDKPFIKYWVLQCDAADVFVKGSKTKTSSALPPGFQSLTS